MPVDLSFDLVLFDLDGTLVETAAELTDAVNDTLADFGVSPVDQGRIERWIGHGTRALLLQALALRRSEPLEVVRGDERLDAMVARFGEHYQRRCGTRSRLYPSVAETLHRLRADRVRMAVLTNKETRFTHAVLEAHGLTPLFDRVICGDTFPTKKHDPVGVLACLTQFGVPASRTLLVGDSSIDVATARQAGIAVWALPYGYNLGQPIEDSEPDRVIADLSALTDTRAPV